MKKTTGVKRVDKLSGVDKSDLLAGAVVGGLLGASAVLFAGGDYKKFFKTLLVQILEEEVTLKKLAE